MNEFAYVFADAEPSRAWHGGRRFLVSGVIIIGSLALLGLRPSRVTALPALRTNGQEAIRHIGPKGNCLRHEY